ncbi:MAG: DUF302 domain-containing protein [Treponema sp.]
MKKLVAIIAAALMSAAVFSQESMMKDNAVLSVTKSKYGFDMTVKKLKDVLKAKGLPVFAEFDHQKNAKEVGLVMPPTTVIVFGNPKAGTQLMLKEPLVSLDLPMKISVIENKDKSVSMVFTNTDELARKYNFQDEMMLSKMQMLMENIIASVNE